jgi:hypothetical protein
MATYVNDLRLKEITTGDESGTWGTSTNTNLELIAEAFSYGTEVITTNADTHTTTIADGASDPGRALYLKYTGTLDSACTITIGPNTVSKVWIVENGTSGSQDIILSQGSGANITIPAGDTKVVYSDGAGAGAAFFDAFANLKVTDPAQTNITSVGTLTVLTGGTGDLNWDSGTLFVDSSANSVGIGTSSPSANLHVSSSGDTIARITSADGNGAFLDLGDASDPDGGRIVYDSGSNLVFSTASTERMRIDSSGNVGIGESNPEANLHVKNASAGTFTASNSNLLVENNTTVRISMVSPNTNGCSIEFGDTDDQDVGQINYDHANNYMAFTTAAAEAMRINSTGVVSIGNAENTGYSDDYLVQVGTDGAGSNSFGMLIKANASGTSKLGFADGGDADGSGKVWYDHSSNYMRFDTAGSERLRIDSSGNVGIGSTSPDELLTLRNADPTLLIQGNQVSGVHYSEIDFKNQAGSVLGKIGLSYYGGVAEFYRNVPTSWSHVWKVNNSEKMRIDSSGNALFGCTALPSAGAGGAAFETGQSSGRSILQLGTTSTSALRLVNFYNGNGNVGNITVSGSATAFNTSSDARLKDVTGKARGLEVINQLNPVSYNWKVDGKADEGLIAQEVLDIVPNAVSGSEEEKYYMDYSKLVVHLVAGIKEQQALIESLTARITTLEG